MRIESKFLKADVRVTTVTLVAGRIVAEGTIKNAMPVKVTMGLDDLRDLVRAVAGPFAERLRDVLPERLARFVAAPETAH
ncbi:MAG: hypothetical protein HYV63_00770 [Candidatus Schekmanbacteria bacterium]|nr:hypothetical protein [Candidatus Schekmanbacteria bacterium]